MLPVQGQVVGAGRVVGPDRGEGGQGQREEARLRVHAVEVEEVGARGVGGADEEVGDMVAEGEGWVAGEGFVRVVDRVAGEHGGQLGLEGLR